MAKYVMTDKGVIVFPDSFSHAEFSHFNPTSAGFAHFCTPEVGVVRVSCGGGSLTLGLKSDPEDSRMATSHLCDY